jgi:hypothetical protein
MAYTTISETRGTLETFAQVDGLLPDTLPDGLLIGIRGMSELGLTIVTVWRSRADADRFSAEHLGPALAKVGGDPAPPPLVSIRVEDAKIWGEATCSSTD